jgi:hypothetical protein
MEVAVVVVLMEVMVFAPQIQCHQYQQVGQEKKVYAA